MIQHRCLFSVAGVPANTAVRANPAINADSKAVRICLSASQGTGVRGSQDGTHERAAEREAERTPVYRGLPGQAVAKNVAVVPLPTHAAASARGRQLPTAEGPPA